MFIIIYYYLVIRPAHNPIDRSKFTSYPDVTTVTHNNILDILWDHDDQRMSVSDRDESGNWRDPNADILLDKQQQAKGSIDSLIDSSPNPLFHTVRTEKFELPTYKAFIELLDNYDAIVNNEEYLDGKELTEINTFLDAILETKCMHICFDYITKVLNVPYDWVLFKKKLFAMWFEIHNLRVDEVQAPAEAAQQRGNQDATRTQRPAVAIDADADDGSDDEIDMHGNVISTDIKYQRGKTIVNYCSGFEHVYMGEITRSQKDDGTKEIGNVLGYHNWIKFYIDERVQLVDYLGTKYAKNSISKIGAPFACIRFRWDQDGDVYVKDRCSFFVGISPEYAMAVATVCYFETYYLESAQRCDWEDRSSSSIKFKTRREVGGYIYDYYICREKKYLVSCFQEIIGPTEATRERLEQEKLAARMEQIAAKEKLIRERQLAQNAKNALAAVEQTEVEEIKEAVESKDDKDHGLDSVAASPMVGPRIVKPKHKPAALDPAWQAFYSTELRRLKTEDPTLSDKVAFKKCKEAWAAQGNVVPNSGAEAKAEAKRARRAAKRNNENNGDGDGDGIDNDNNNDLVRNTLERVHEDMEFLSLNPTEA